MLRSLLLALSSSRTLRRLAERNPVGTKLASRFVAGSTPADALDATRRLLLQGLSVTLDSLGESVNSAEEVRTAAGLYHQLLEAIGTNGWSESASHPNVNISLKLTQLGLDLSPALLEEIVGGLVAHAAAIGAFVRIDMEGSIYTDRTLDLTRRLNAAHPGSVGTVLQACLRRTPTDAERLLREGIRIRLCKGAYKESLAIALPEKAEVDTAYVQLMHRLTSSGVYCGIATHDEAIVGQMLRFAAKHHLPPSVFEFQMLYGIRRDLQADLVRQGFRVRVYLPFGTAWYPYFMRRLAERPANLLFLLRNLVR